VPDEIDIITPDSNGRIEPVDLQTEMQRSYLDYSMSVIVSRALPDVRDGLKPVHRRVLYAMYDGGYRPDRNFSKSARVVGDVMGSYHPHGDSAIYDALVRLAQPWSLRYPLVQGQGNFGSPGNDPPAAQRYTECRMAQLAMEMVRDIDEETVDFIPNYDGRTLEPSVLPSRFPNLLVNGSAGIAVGMATNIPPHNLGEIAAAATWMLENPESSTEERMAALMDIVKGPDFPTGATIIGRRGIEDAQRTGRGSITMRAVVEVDEDSKGRQRLVVTELPYQVNPDNLLLRIAELVGDGKLTGISDVRDDSSSRTGMRLIIELKRDAVAQVVLNQLYKHTQLQDNFGANMLALVDGVPRTLTLEQFLRYWIAHQIEVIQRRTRYRLRKAEERAHILSGYLKALDALDEVIALIRASATVEDARSGLMDLLEIDELQATAILDMQLRRLAAMERQKIIDEFEDLMTKIADYNDILSNEPRQRSIVAEELKEITDKYADSRRTEILPWDGEVTDEDLIAVEDVVVTITAGGYAKRTRSDLYRAQRRGGRGVRGAALRQDDVVEHFMVTSTHNWLLFFTNMGRVYRAKGYQLPEASRDAKGQHVANLLAFRPEESIASVLSIPSYDAADYLVLATRSGLVKKTRLDAFDTNRQGGIIAINLNEGDEVIGARLVSAEDDIFLASTKGMSVRFTASDEVLRPMGRDTRGVIGMRFREGDSLLSMDVVKPGSDIVTITDGGFAKRTKEEEWTSRGRGILGVRAMKINEKRGSLVAAMVCEPDDQIFAIASNGVVIRTSVSEMRPSGRDTMGVTMMRLGDEDSVVAVARSGEKEAPDDEDGDDTDSDVTDSDVASADGGAAGDAEASESQEASEQPQEGEQT
jgi:DNA gyrase subunit A